MAESAPRKNTREEITEQAIRLFARSGFDGVSMREVAAAAGVTVSALYYHFSDKDQLYLDAVARACLEKAAVIKDALEGPDPPEQRLEAFVTRMARLLSEDKDLLRLMQWVLLDNDLSRTSRLVREVFQAWFTSVHKLARELGGGYDPHLLALSIVSLVFHPLVAQHALGFLPEYPGRSGNPAALGGHALRLLRTGLAQGDSVVGDAVGNGR